MIYNVISYTTRKKRKSETNGIDYFFVSDKEFEKLKNNDFFFVEYAKVFDNWYGTPKKIVMDHLQNGVDVVFDIDWQGAQKLYNFQVLIWSQFYSTTYQS